MSEHDIDVLLNAARRGENLDIPAGWGQGRATYGGLVAAVLAARAIGASELDPATLRALTTNFLAPVVVGPARVSAEILRRGSSATQVEVRIEQPDDAGAPSLRAVALATFGTPRGRPSTSGRPRRASCLIPPIVSRGPTSKASCPSSWPTSSFVSSGVSCRSAARRTAT